MYTTVYDYIKGEETAFKAVKIPVVESWDWNMYEHIQLTNLYLNSQYQTGKEEDKPFRNIILPKINLEHRAVEFDVKEIEFYINSEDEAYKSFLVRKWHERWALQTNLSDFLDRLTETYTDYGGVLIEDSADALAVVPFERLAFCDQTDMMSAPICQKHQYSPDQLKEMEAKGWKNIDLVIALAQEEKIQDQSSGVGGGTKVKTPGRYIEVYDLEGYLPDSYLSEGGSPNTFSHQLHLVTYYTDKSGHKEGITLYEGKKAPGRYKAFKRDEIFSRALGRGGVEELFEPQVWANYSEIAKKELLDAASKVLYETTDLAWKGKNVAETEQNDVVTHAAGTEFNQMNTGAINATLFDNAFLAWDTTAREIASAQPTITGDETKSGMPFRLGALLNQESHSLHQYRKKRLGIFLTNEVYPDWVLPKMQKEVANGAEFLSCLSLDEMGELVDQVVAYSFNEWYIQQILAGNIISPEEAQQRQNEFKQQFFKSNRKFIKILKGELKDLPIEVEVNITGEQRNKALIAEKLSSIFTQVTQILLANPNFFTEHPEMAKLFNQIIEASGLSALNFGMKGYLKPPVEVQPAQGNPQLTPPANAQNPVPAPVQSQPQIG